MDSTAVYGTARISSILIGTTVSQNYMDNEPSEIHSQFIFDLREVYNDLEFQKELTAEIDKEVLDDIREWQRFNS